MPSTPSAAQQNSGRGSKGSNSYLKLLSLRTIRSVAFAAVDTVADYHTRQNVYNSVRRFCYNRPVTASFLALQLLFALLPTLFFLFFSLGVLSFCLLAALAVAGFWIGLAGLTLLTTISLLSVVAGGLWVYLICCYYIARMAANYAGLIGNGNDKAALVKRDYNTATENRGGYNYGRQGATDALPLSRSSSTGSSAEKKVAFDVKEEEEVKKEEGGDAQDDVVPDVGGHYGGVKREEDEEDSQQQQIREQSPSQHSDGEYLDIRNVT